MKKLIIRLCVTAILFCVGFFCLVKLVKGTDTFVSNLGGGFFVYLLLFAIIFALLFSIQESLRWIWWIWGNNKPKKPE